MHVACRVHAEWRQPAWRNSIRYRMDPRYSAAVTRRRNADSVWVWSSVQWHRTTSTAQHRSPWQLHTTNHCSFHGQWLNFHLSTNVTILPCINVWLLGCTFARRQLPTQIQITDWRRKLHLQGQCKSECTTVLLPVTSPYFYQFLIILSPRLSRKCITNQRLNVSPHYRVKYLTPLWLTVTSGPFFVPPCITVN